MGTGRKENEKAMRGEELYAEGPHYIDKETRKKLDRMSAKDLLHAQYEFNNIMLGKVYDCLSKAETEVRFITMERDGWRTMAMRIFVSLIVLLIVLGIALIYR